MSEQPAQAAAGDESSTLQARLEGADAGAAAPTIADPAGLLRHLDVSGHFHRDGRLGRAYHPGTVSLREDVPTDSLHVSVDDNRVMAHVDEVSPLAEASDGPSRYSVPRAAAHNLAGMATDLVTFLRGREGDHRCELNCEWVSGEAGGAPGDGPLLDPATSAWSVQLEARVAGSLDEARLQAAIGVAMGRRAQPDCLEVVECDDDAALDDARTRLYGTGVPITSFPPLRVCLARHGGGDVVMLNVNHAAADGFGALGVLRRIARAYSGGDTGQDAVLDFLASRDLPVVPASVSTPMLVRYGRTATVRLRDKLDPPARLAAADSRDDERCGFCVVALSAEQTRRVIDAERSGRHVLLAALHLAIADWNSEHGSPARRIGVLVAANLRPPERRDEQVGNFSVNSRLSTGRRDRARPASVLKAIAVQMDRTKRTRTGVALIAALERAGLLALWAKQSSVVLRPVTDNHWVDTAMLSDLGNIDAAPSFGPGAGDTLELWFSAPTRSPLALSIGAATLDGRLHLSFRHPYRLFGPEGARRFADCFVDQIRLVAA